MTSSSAQIQQVQFEKIQSLLKAVLPANPFYARKLADCKPVRSLEEFTRNLPLTTRHEVVRDRLENPPYGTNLTFPVETYIRCHQTSGTTTVPIRWLDTTESWHHIVENWVQILG